MNIVVNNFSDTFQRQHSMSVIDRGLCCLHANDMGLLERINCTDKQYLSDDEKEIADKMAEHMISELRKVHRFLHAE